MTLVRRVLWLVLFLEVGLLLVAVPWSTYWDRNLFLREWPAARPFVLNLYVRGAVSGLGLVNLAGAVADVVSLAASVRGAWRDALRRAQG